MGVWMLIPKKCGNYGCNNRWPNPTSPSCWLHLDLLVGIVTIPPYCGWLRNPAFLGCQLQTYWYTQKKKPRDYHGTRPTNSNFHRSQMIPCLKQVDSGGRCFPAGNCWYLRWCSCLPYIAVVMKLATMWVVNHSKIQGGKNLGEVKAVTKSRICSWGYSDIMLYSMKGYDVSERN